MQEIHEEAGCRGRFGYVSAYDPKRHMARIRFPDKDNLISAWLPVSVPNSKNNKDECHLDVDEHVFCVMLGNGLEVGIVLCSLYDDKNTPEVQRQDQRTVTYADRTRELYNRRRHEHRTTLTPDAENSVEYCPEFGRLEEPEGVYPIVHRDVPSAGPGVGHYTRTEGQEIARWAPNGFIADSAGNGVVSIGTYLDPQGDSTAATGLQGTDVISLQGGANITVDAEDNIVIKAKKIYLVGQVISEKKPTYGEPDFKTPARTVLRFYLEQTLNYNVTIPGGTVVKTQGGPPFRTDKTVTLYATGLEVAVTATCVEPGEVGNRFEPGQVNIFEQTYNLKVPDEIDRVVPLYAENITDTFGGIG